VMNMENLGKLSELRLLVEEEKARLEQRKS
jgi:hypothetical protein